MTNTQASVSSPATHTILDIGTKAEDYQRLINDIRLQKELKGKPEIEKQIYFDTSGAIDMLTGMHGMIDRGRINQRYYDRLTTLVYALAYKHWLGEIYTLPPHSEELFNKIKNNQYRFPDQPADKFESLEKEFWADRKLKIDQFQADLADEKKREHWIELLKEESVDLFKGVYLTDRTSFWKRRYKYLVKEAEILRFSSDMDYRLGDLTQSKLFTPLLKYLNSKREKSSNNYIDAIVLCMLDKKLEQFKSDKTNQLPLFFSDQEHILEAVSHFSKQSEIFGRRPFVYEGETGNYLIVRNANFFIIEGLFNAIQKHSSPAALESYERVLESLQEWLLGVKSRSEDPEAGAEQAEMIKIDFREQSAAKFFLEFFDRWWDKQGFEELKQVVVSSYLEENRSQIEKQIADYIEEERDRINKQFEGYEGRIMIIRKTWNHFDLLPKFVRDNFAPTGGGFDIFKEFGPRFSYTEKVCEATQDLADRIFDAVFRNDKDELGHAEAEVVTNLINGLFGRSQTNEEKDKKLDQLAIALAIFWVFEFFDLICEVCQIIRKQYEQDDSNDDMYPSPSIALMHAAAVIQGRSKDQKLVERILKCVNRKFGEKYNVWIGLSYINYLRWNDKADSFKFPERLSPEEIRFNRETPYLTEALKYSKKAVDYLEDRRKDPREGSKIKHRQRKYYYALNNYIFFQTICAPAIEFETEEMSGYAEKLEDSSRNPDYWQADRFPDTLSRYFFRRAFLAAARKEEYAQLLSEAIRYNEMAIKGTTKEKNIYFVLRRQLMELQQV